MSILIDTLLEIIKEEYKKRELEWKITCNLYHIHKDDITYL